MEINMKAKHLLGAAVAVAITCASESVNLFV